MKCATRCAVWITAVFTLGQGCALETATDAEVEVQEQALVFDFKRDKLLALGDSIAFGYRPFAFSFEYPRLFVGYPQLLRRYSVDNASCPGESSSSFLSSEAPDNGCDGYRGAYPLHTDWGDAETQLDYAIAQIIDPETRPDVITLNIAGNDIFLLQAACASDPDPEQCFADGLPAMIGTLAQNVGTILGTLRAVGYEGPIVFVNLYSTDYQDPLSVAVVTAINDAIGLNVLPAFAGVVEADAYGALEAAAGDESVCDAGLLVPLPEGDGCDVHPSRIGHAVIARSIRQVLP